jgi:hypothetical protein
MTTSATMQKRHELARFIETALAPDPAVQGVIGIGSIASGQSRPDSDIDALVFLEPFDLYAVPAEFKWRPADGTFHSIFSAGPGLAECIDFDLVRLDLAAWSDPNYAWPDGRRAEMQAGWLAFDRDGRIASLIAERTAYPAAERTARLDEAITWLDQHLGGDGPTVRWESLGPLLAHDRLQAAYGYLVQALFAYNRRWQAWRNREMPALLALPWLPDGFAERMGEAAQAPAPDYAGYTRRVTTLRSLFADLAERLRADGDYGQDLVGEAFIRSHKEPGRAWNMDEWNARHRSRKVADDGAR